jgi:hypothetical protein
MALDNRRPLTDRDPVVDPDPMIDTPRPLGTPYRAPSNAGSWMLGIIAVLAVIGIIFWLSSGSHRLTTASNTPAPSSNPTVTQPSTTPPATQPATQPAPKSP